MFEKKSGLEFQYIFIKQYNFNDYKCICFTLFNSIYGKKPCKHNDYNKRIQAIYLENLYAWY